MYSKCYHVYELSFWEMNSVNSVSKISDFFLWYTSNLADIKDPLKSINIYEIQKV